jgi:hypothetical protein
MFIFDDINPIERIKVSAQLAVESNALKAANNAIQRIKHSKQVAELLKRLGVGQKPVEAVGVDDAPTKKFYSQEERRTKGSRQKQNDAAIELLARIKAENRLATEEEKAILAKYSGNGGGLINADGLKGSPYEYYTPPFVAEASWGLLKDLGFAGGKVLDPCAGSGVFAATRPSGTLIEQVELDETSGGVNGLVNNSETCSTTISPFERIAANTPDEIYDAVVSNVPFGDVTMRGDNRFLDTKYQDKSLEHYFVLRSLEKLKPNGLAMFIVPPRVVSDKGSAMSELRYRASLMAEFMGAYRLPNEIFVKASDADTIVDVIVFKKHSKEIQEKIADLTVDDLEAANVLWGEFLQGDYFKGEGKRFMLGNFVPKDPNKYRDVDRVISDDKPQNIVALMRKFGGSRIKFDVLDASVPQMITYQNGDTQYVGGEILEYQDGNWIKRESSAQNAFADVGNKLDQPMNAIIAGITWEQASLWMNAQQRMGRYIDIPTWMTTTYNAIAKMPESQRANAWDVLITGQAIQDVIDENPSPFDYLTAFTALSNKMEAVYAGSKRVKTSVKQMSDAAKRIALYYSKKEGFSAVWKGQVAGQIDAKELTTDTQRYEHVKYKSADDFGYVPIDELKAVMGADFDPIASDDYCVSPDGKYVISANDYYTGNFAEFSKAFKQDLDSATDPVIRAKLLRQFDVAQSKLVKPDVERMTFNMFTPFITTAQKVEFLKSQVDPRFDIDVDDAGKPIVVVNIAGSDKTEYARQLKRFAEHLREGTLSTRTKKDDIAANPELENARIAQLREMVNSTNAKFNVWVKSNDDALQSVKDKLHAPDNLYFKQVEDGSDLAIEGINPNFKPHDYQFAEIRRQARKFGGINGFGVGLGKTATALLSIQHAQNIGVKKKTLVVVPNAVLSNWRKETKGVYADTSDCLFVGLDVDETGNATVKSSNYARDMQRILENKHRKVFMTMEAFKAIPMRDETKERYQSYIEVIDPSYSYAPKVKKDGEESNASMKAKIKSDARKEDLVRNGETSNLFPYFEDMGFDSLVMDEAHQAKNAKTLREFKGARFLSTPSASDRGADAQIKAWYIRGLSPKKDGVLALTATPITNSPLEVYAMLSLAIGEEELTKRLGGVTGADDFMNAFTKVDNTEELDLVGRPKMGRVFLGLQNVNLLRNVLGEVANIKSAEDVGASVKLPQEDATSHKIELDEASKKRLMAYKELYIAASNRVYEKINTPEQDEALDRYMAQTGLTVDLVAHPFNLIDRMSRLIMDKDLELGATVYHVSPSQRAIAEKAVQQFNAKKFNEKRERAGQLAKAENVTTKNTKDKDGNDTKELTVKVEAWIDDNGSIVIDTDRHDTQNKFLAIAEKLGLDLDVSLSPKLAAFIEQFKKEHATPKGGSFAKQIVFVDMLAMHNKVKIALQKHCGIPMSKIAIISAQAIDDPADMQDVQDGFNAEGEDNRYMSIIANKKAEVGINLQKRTQAIHHLTIGWTPDSLTQRNGRGVRQGNKLAELDIPVRVYYYDANGTFDEYKRMLVGKKGNWIDSVMGKDGNDSDTVTVSAGLTNAELDDLLRSSGDAEASAKAKENIAKRERLQQREATRENQAQTLRVLKGQFDWLKNFGTADKFLKARCQEHYELSEKVRSVAQRAANTESENVRKKMLAMKVDLDAKLAELTNLISNSMTDYNGKTVEGLPYRAPYSSRDKEVRLTGSNVIEGTAVFDKFTKEKIGVEKAAKQARTEFERDMTKYGGYDATTLEAFEDGSAVVVNGRIVAVGMVAIHNNERWVIRKDGRELEMFLPPMRKELAANASSKFSFIGRNDEEWDGVIAELVAMDEATIANDKDGFKLGDERLYSSFLDEVKALVKAVPKSVRTYPDRLHLAPPYFEKPIKPDAKGGVLTRFIVKQQSSVLSWAEDGNTVQANSIDVLGERSGEGMGKMMINFAIAHNLKMDAEDVNANAIGWQREYFFRDAQEKANGFATEFKEGLQAIVTEAKTATDLENWLNALAEKHFTFIEFGSYLAPDEFLNSTQKRAYEGAFDAIKAGGKTVVWMNDSATSNFYARLSSIILDKAKEEPELFMTEDKKVMPIGDALRVAFDAYVLGDDFEGFEGAKTVKPDVATLLLEYVGSTGRNTNGSIVLYRSDDLPIELVKPYGNWHREIEQLVKVMAASAVAGDMDINGIIDAVKGFGGVTDVFITSDDVARPAKYGNGKYLYQAGKTIAIKSTKTDAFSRFSDRDEGLAGRHWDKDNKRWVFTIADGELDSFGKPIASISDFCKYMDIDISNFVNKQ